MVEAIKHELRQSGLTVTFVQVPTAERIAALKARQVRSRMRLGAEYRRGARRSPSPSRPISPVRILKAKGAPIEKLVDITGKTVVTTEGTTASG